MKGLHNIITISDISNKVEYSVTMNNQEIKQDIESLDNVLKSFLYGYEKNGVLDISKYDLTYRQALDQVHAITRHDDTFNIFVIKINRGRSTTSDMSEKAETVQMMLSPGFEEQFDLLPSVNKKMEDIIASMLPSWSDFEKALYIHDWICLNAFYDEAAPNAHELSGTLLEGKGVCQSFTYTFNTIMYRLGIPAQKVYGSQHIWSQVCLDGHWYHMDITQDNMFDLGGVHHLCTFTSQKRLFKITNRDINKCSLPNSKPMSEDLALHTQYEQYDKRIGLLTRNMWSQEDGSFQYYDGYWYNGGQKYGKYDPRINKYTVSNEVWVYKYNPDTKDFESIGTGLPSVDWKDTYRGLFIAGDTALTRTDHEFIGIDLKTGKADVLLQTDAAIKDYYTDYTGIVKYRLTGDKTVYQWAL